jgi:hypothetical protein
VRCRGRRVAARDADDIEVGVCPNFPTETTEGYPGKDVRIIEKAAAIPSDGFVVNVEIPRTDVFENDGVFKPEDMQRQRPRNG